MTKGILATLALVALGGTAFAADLPSRKGPVYAPVAPIFTWTGFYAGVNAGAAFTDNNIRTSGTTGPTGLSTNTILNVQAGRRPGSTSIDDQGFIGGAQIGYNYQMGAIVLGVEADIQYTDLEKRTTVIGTPVVGTLSAASTFRQELNYLGTVRARVGYAFDRALVYATAGLAYGDVQNSATFTSATVPNQIDYFGRRSDVEVGYTVGGGIEYALTNNISLKGEYLYYDLGKKNVPVNLAAGPAGGSYVSKFENNGHIVRAGLNYRFSTY